MNPVALPMDHLLVDGHGRERWQWNALFRFRLFSSNAENTLVLVRENLDELGKHRRPVIEDPFRLGTSRGFEMLRDPAPQKLDIAGVHHRLQVYPGQVAPLLGDRKSTR